MIFATRLFLDEPIVIIKPSICTKGRQEDNEYVVENVLSTMRISAWTRMNLTLSWSGMASITMCQQWRQ